MIAQSCRKPGSLALVLLTSLLGLPAIGARWANRPFVRRSLAVDGTERQYLIYSPADARSAVKGIVVLLHGHGSSAEDLVGQGRGRAAPYRHWIGIADREQLVLIVPDGLIGSDGRQGCNDCRADAATNLQADDVGFIAKLVDSVAREYRIRRPRVFVVGTSNGGHMALRLAIEQPRLVAAVAAIVAAMPARSQCVEPTGSVPVLFMNGTSDPLLPYEGGPVGGSRGGGGDRGSVLSTEESVGIWRRLAGEALQSASTTFPDSSIPDSSHVVRTTYSKGDSPVVVLYRIEGGGHSEPSPTERYARFYTDFAGPQNADIEMAPEVWSFFSMHPHFPSGR
jgi:polyhydroxybutyrate depolymerase